MKQSEIKAAARKATARKEETVTLNFITGSKSWPVDIPADVFRACEAIAKARRVSLQTVIDDAFKQEIARAEGGIDRPLTITLTPRLSMALRWEAMMFDRTPEQQAIIHIAESVKDVTGDYFSSENNALAWLKEGSPAEGVLEAYFEDWKKSREEAAS